MQAIKVTVFLFSIITIFTFILLALHILDPSLTAVVFNYFLLYF